MTKFDYSSYSKWTEILKTNDSKVSSYLRARANLMTSFYDLTLFNSRDRHFNMPSEVRQLNSAMNATSGHLSI